MSILKNNSSLNSLYILLRHNKTNAYLRDVLFYEDGIVNIGCSFKFVMS
jgi:hypothetical protein